MTSVTRIAHACLLLLLFVLATSNHMKTWTNLSWHCANQSLSYPINAKCQGRIIGLTWGGGLRTPSLSHRKPALYRFGHRIWSEVAHKQYDIIARQHYKSRWRSTWHKIHWSVSSILSSLYLAIRLPPERSANSLSRYHSIKYPVRHCLLSIPTILGPHYLS